MITEAESLQVLWEDAERIVYRASRNRGDGNWQSFIFVRPATDTPTTTCLERLVHEYGLRDYLDPSWAAQPLELRRDGGRTSLVLSDPGAEPLHRLLGKPMELSTFLPLAEALAVALGGLHKRSLIHKDINPANVLADAATGQVWLTGFGISSRLPRERQAAGPPEFIAGTLPYIAPEQTGQMNRSIDSRTDLYSLGVTLYQMLTGTLPFIAPDPMGWVHCHIARIPPSPRERLATVPIAVSRIVMKLLAKTAEERYQTAAGLKHDVRRCREEFELNGTIEEFTLAEHDSPDRLLIPEKLYGRARELTALQGAFEKVVSTGMPQFILVSGYSGIGKSSVVNELHRTLIPSRGLFASGKFDQYMRGVPYATLAQAFQSLVRQILSKSEVELAAWRTKLHEAVAPNGLLMVGLIPELDLIIGQQPPVPDLSPQDAQKRFQKVLRAFIGVIARPEHPLTLFLDDLQWIDAATLDLLEDLLVQPDIHNLLVIGAYRDNEVGSAHPLTRKLESIAKAGGAVQEIVLAPLTYHDLEQLIVESLHCNSRQASPLVAMVHEKTGGNPFFAIQFLYALEDESLLKFDHNAMQWSWDLDLIHAQRYTENVVDLMVIKFNRLPANTQAALRQLACVGPTCNFSFLAMLCQCSPQLLHESLLESVRSGLVVKSENDYAFQHDRIQEAAYSLISVADRTATHLLIGRLLLANTVPEKVEEIVFELVSQFNRSSDLITLADEREQVAQLNLLAGKRARKAAAYSSALTYFAAGRALLENDCWKLPYPLTFELEFLLAECEFLTGDLSAAQERLSALSNATTNLVDKSAVTCLRVDLYAVLGRSDLAVGVCLEYLQQIGLEWSPHPTEEEVRQEYEKIWRKLGVRTIEELIDLPKMTDTGTQATMDVLTKVMPSTMCTDDRLLCMVISRMVNLSLEYGNSNASCCGYAWLGLLLSSYFEDFPAARRFGRLSLALVEQRGLDAFRARVYEAYGIFVSPWAEHVRTGRALIKQAFVEAHRIGDLTYASYCCNNLVTSSLACGERLAAVEAEAAEGLRFALKADFVLVVDIMRGQLSLIRSLRGLSSGLDPADDTTFDELTFVQRLESEPNLVIAACWYWVRKLQASVLLEDYSVALAAANKARALLWTSPAFFEQAEYHFYAALAHAGLLKDIDSVSAAQRATHLEAIGAHCRQIRVWAEQCPENFENRASLVEAELARLQGQESDAERLYEQAVCAARVSGFVHNEALACEVAGRFYSGRRLESISEMYLLRARNGYLRWGADGKVKQLETRYPQLTQEPPSVAAGASFSSNRHVDVAALVKASLALSSEMLPPNLIERLMRIAVESAGADRGLLILHEQDSYHIEAEARTDGEGIVHHYRESADPAAPETIIRYVMRTHKSVIIEDATRQSLFSEDPYLTAREPRSILCIPLIRQGVLGGLIYLENTLAAHVFTPNRAALLELLASQAAISLENTRLYGDLQEREARVRRLVDSNIIGIFMWNLEGRITDANQAFLGIIAQERDALRAGQIDWRAMTPSEWCSVDEERLAELKATGVAEAYEKELFRKDGTRVPVLMGVANFNGTRDEGVAFVVDLTDRKRAEESARKSERQYHDIQMQLAHANRVTTLGHLSASIAHELSQPLSGTLVSAETALLWLTQPEPNLPETIKAITRAIRDANRATQVFGRIRTLVKKAPPQQDSLDINEVIVEIVGLAHGEVAKNDAQVEIRLGEELPLIRGDRVQVQQVTLNLIMNALEAVCASSTNLREILISTCATDLDEVQVCVQDSGPGIDQDNLERIFDAFYTTKANGLGMGLSICRSIIEAHGGRLWATKGEPQGAVLQFTLPGDGRRQLGP